MCVANLQGISAVMWFLKCVRSGGMRPSVCGFFGVKFVNPTKDSRLKVTRLTFPLGESCIISLTELCSIIISGS